MMLSEIEKAFEGTRVGVENDEFSRSGRHLLRALSDPKASPLDLAVLVRNVLRHEDRDNRASSSLLVPMGKRLPTKEMWESVGIRAIPVGEHFRLTAREWKPAWLEGGRIDPFSDAFAEIQRREDRHTFGDPFLSVCGFDSYRNVAQREAVRASLIAPPGSTLVVNLPTGSGKSLCAHSSGLVSGDGSPGVTVVIIPTDALNIDQERKLAQFLGQPCAYRGHGDQSTRTEILRRIHRGEQRVVFTAPEAFCKSMRNSVEHAAREGHLKALVIDEAHIVNSWGESFRPEFQELAGIRRLLLRECPKGRELRTLLLSATLTPYCIDLLRCLFPAITPDLFRCLQAPVLRPEPSYWFSECATEGERIARLLEVVRNAPRPLLIYSSLVSRKENDPASPHGAEDIARVLRNAGYSRVHSFTGNTRQADRTRIVEAWNESQLDIVVGTSAFGLGVDKSDVRAVIHACIPESLDRFYQEVGRGGRDGHAFTSMTLYTGASEGEGDVEVAGGLKKRMNIGVEKGLPRWTAMFQNAESLGDGRYRTNIDMVPAYRGEATWVGKQNREWNSKTLLLMARAHLLHSDAEPTSIGEAEDDTQHEAKQSRVIQISSTRHLELETWDSEVEEQRKRSMSEANRNLTLMLKVLEGKKCIAQHLSKMYSSEGKTEVVQSCGGCPRCRSEGKLAYEGVGALTRDVWPVASGVGEHLAQLFKRTGLLLITYEATNEVYYRIARLINWLVRQGVLNFLYEPGGPRWEKHLSQSFKKLASQLVFTNPSVCNLKTGLDGSPLVHPYPTCLMFDVSSDTLNENWKWIERLKDSDFPVVLLLPQNTPDPDRPDRKLKDVMRSHVDLREFQARFGI